MYLIPGTEGDCGVCTSYQGLRVIVGCVPRTGGTEGDCGVCTSYRGGLRVIVGCVPRTGGD